MFSFKNLIIILSVLWISLHWTEAQKSNASLNRPNFQISHLNLEPIIDGNILNDKVWQGISPITQMIQIKPEFNVPSTEKTEIRVATYKNTFYVAVVCYDST
ncbi:MAG: hydrolase, partial [Bacteroidetes bacterium]|nr:hydrolase [Bacteroidota bacterium]